MSGAPDLHRLTDEQLAVLVQAGGPQASRAYATLYKRHVPAVLSFLAARLKDRPTADDLCQQAWMKVWESLATRFTAEHFRGWVFQIARNLLLDTLRRRRAATGAEEFDPVDPRDDFEDELDDRVEHLQPCVEALPNERRQIVAARMAGDSFDDISASLGIPPNTAMTRFHRAKDQLRDCIERRSS